jgi:hypothetical protein
MGTPVSENYMEPGGAKWVIGADGELEILGVVTGGLYVKRYFVDNVNGDDDNDGLTWSTAFAQVDAAVTAWEAYRATLDNVYSRGAIYVRGTATAYDALAALPSYCDIIGVGANPNGNGTGIAIIGANGADGIAGTARGLGLYNLQIVSGGAFWCCDFVSLFRSTIKNCAFQTKDAATDGAIRFTASSGGVTIENCHWMGSGNVIAKIGMEIDGPNFNDCLIKDCEIHGTSKGVYVANTCSTGQNGTAADNTVFKNNIIGDLGRGCAVGVDDDEVAGMIVYAGNYVIATDCFQIANAAGRVIANWTNEGATYTMEQPVVDG